MQVFLIPGMICIHQRNLMLPRKVHRHISNQHRLMHMNQIKGSFLKLPTNDRIHDIGNHHFVFQSFLTGTISYNIFFLFIFCTSLILRCKDTNLMSFFPEPFCKVLYGNRNSAYKRFIIIRHHCNSHFMSLPLAVTSAGSTRHLPDNIRLLQRLDSKPELQEEN